MASAGNETSTVEVPTDLENPEAEDLDVFVKDLMDNMQTRFNRLSDTIVGRIDDMGSKIDELEKSVNELMDQAGIEGAPTSEAGGDKNSGISDAKGNAKR